MRDRQTERLGGLEIDDQLEFGRLLRRQVGGLLAAYNPTGIDALQAIYGGKARPVAG